MRWKQGREVIERMLADRQLQQLPANQQAERGRRWAVFFARR